MFSAAGERTGEGVVVGRTDRFPVCSKQILHFANGLVPFGPNGSGSFGRCAVLPL